MKLIDALFDALSNVKEVASAGLARYQELLGGFRRHQQEILLTSPKRRRGHSAKSPVWHKTKGYGDGLTGRRRLGRARGPGSINAKADGLQLARTGQWQAAAEMLEQADPALATRYRRLSRNAELIPHELSNATPAWPFNARLVP